MTITLSILFITIATWFLCLAVKVIVEAWIMFIYRNSEEVLTPSSTKNKTKTGNGLTYKSELPIPLHKAISILSEEKEIKIK